MGIDAGARRKNGGELLAETLKAAGVSKIFALHGGHLEALFKGCVEQDIDLIDFRHEAAAGHAADAYARTTGKLGVCIVTAGPGFANAISAIMNAKLDGSPVLFIIGAPPIREVETNPLQGGVDQIAIARPCAKWAVSVPATERIPDLAAMAIRKAMTGPRGPVVLELPIDILHMSVRADRATLPAGLSVLPRPAPAAEETRRLAALVREARRPVVIAGFEAVASDAGEMVRALSDRTGIPVFSKSQAAGLLPADHPGNGGSASGLAMLPMFGIERPDLVILLGARLGLLLGGRSGMIVPHDAKLAQIYSEASEIGRIRDVDLAICADAGEAARALVEALDSEAPDHGAWRDTVTVVRHAAARAYPETTTKGGIHPYHAAKAVAEITGREACYVFDGGEAATWGDSATDVDHPRSLLGHGYLGCLGIGPGMAIGMQAAHPGRRVVHLTGDGALGFHIQEFDTMVRHGLPILTVVLNNEVWGMSIHGQQLMFGSNYHVITKLSGADYTAVASAFGCHAERVTQYEEIAPAVQRALDSGRPAFVEIMTDADVVHPVTVNMLGQIAEGSNDIMIPYYENIPVEA